MELEKYLISDFNSSDIEKFKMSVDKQNAIIKPQTAIAHHFVKAFISKYYMIPMDTINFKYNKNGKPFFEGILQFSITHSGNYVFCAYDDVKIGIDVEVIKPISHSILKKITSEEENPDIDDYSDVEVLKIWTIKEAYIKLIGSTITKAKNFSIKEIKEKYEVKTIITDEYVLSIVKQKQTYCANR